MVDPALPEHLAVRDKSLDISFPRIIGILNATPDSFSDGGIYDSVDSAMNRIDLMISRGAAVIDVGGESTRPGSEPVAEEQEMERVIPILKEAISRFPDTLFSIDTTKYEVARRALDLGVHFINDISGLKRESRFAVLCREYNAGLVLMHSQGDPQTMQHNPIYEDVVNDIYKFFEQQLALAEGVKTIILDPGIGFGKTQEHNLKLLRDLDKFRDLGYPLMVGASRKSMIGKLLNDRPVDDRVTGTVAVHYHAMLKGANLVRVHDVKEANDSILVYNALGARPG